MSNEDSHPKKLCDDCTTELVMVAKFREKCDISAAALDQLKRQMNKEHKSEEIVSTDAETNHDAFYESLEYTEENVEYVIYDTTADLIEETDIQDKSQSGLDSDEVDIIEEDQIPCEMNQIEVCMFKCI